MADQHAGGSRGDGVLAAVDGVLAEHFGHAAARASVSFVGVEPIEVLRFEPIPGERAYLTLGMSRHPMSGADAVTIAPDGPRAELMLHVYDPADRFADVWRRLALLAAAPAVEGVVYSVGMTVDTGESLASGSRCTGVVVGESPLPDVPSDAGAVAIRQVVPASSTELAWGRVHGAPALRDRWAAAGTDLLDLARAPVDLA